MPASFASPTNTVSCAPASANVPVSSTTATSSEEGATSERNTRCVSFCDVTARRPSRTATCPAYDPAGTGSTLKRERSVSNGSSSSTTGYAGPGAAGKVPISAMCASSRARSCRVLATYRAETSVVSPGSRTTW